MMQPFNIEQYVQKYKNEKGFKNIVPLWPQSKRPAVEDYDYWFSNVYDGKYEHNQNIGVILGEIGGGIFGIDDDTFGNAQILEEFPNTFRTKSGEKGYHRFYRMSELPPYNSLKAAKDGHVIEFFFRKRQFVLPPSIHPDTKQRYEIIDDSPVRTITKSEFEEMIKTLARDGWTLKKNDDEKRVIDRIKEGNKLTKGENRSEDLLTFIDSLVFKLREYNLPESIYQQIGLWYHREFTTEMYPQTKIEGIVRQAFEWANERPEKNIEDDFNNFINNGCADIAPVLGVIKLVGLYIKKEKIIEKSELRKILGGWVRKFNFDLTARDIDGCISSVWQNKTALKEIKQLALQHGKNHHEITLDKDQLIEAAYWLIGRYSIKRIELTGDLIWFTGKCYSRDDSEEHVRREARKILITSTKTETSEIVSMIQDTCPIIGSKELDRFVHLKCLENGIYNIKTGEFNNDFDPEYIILNEIPNKFNDSTNWLQMEETIKQIITNEKDRQTYYDFLSTCFHPYTGIDFMLIGYGRAGTGKSQVLERLPPFIFGEDNISKTPIHLLAKDQTIQNDVAFKFYNIDPDLSDQDIKQISTIKKWVTQDGFTGRSIYAHSTTFRPMARLAANANKLFEIADNEEAEAMYQRCHIIEMNEKFRGTDKEIKNVFKNIIEQDQEELDSFTTFLLKNATILWQRKKIHYPMKPHEVEAIWNKFGNYVRDFISKYIVRLKEDTTTKPTKRESIWNAWQDYALEREIDEKTKNRFYDMFTKIIEIEPTKVKDERGGTVVAFPGIRLKTESELQEDIKIASAKVLKESMSDG